ncbi:MAG: DNA cytosine methyltransferase [Treponema sp.]|nr:DNA cytosine methyltransferase [Treponema sp.]
MDKVMSYKNSQRLGQVFTVGEMFSGPGGIGTALNLVNYKNSRFDHVWATDYDLDTAKTYKNNVLKNCPMAKFICDDIKKINIDDLPIVDGLLYGFPCNDFSLVGEQKGFNGEFGPLYTYGVKYIERVNPLFFFAENVTGLTSANDGKAFKKILYDLNHAGKYGYTITANMYKFEEYGVPQTRHRYILIGIRGDLGLKFQVPKPISRMITCKEALANIPLECSNQELTKQSEIVKERLSYIRAGENVWQAADRMPEYLRLNTKNTKISQIYRRLDPNKPAYTITGSGGGGTHVYHWSEPRALTNRERARLQTFPDDFIFYGTKESVRKQIGMAVPVNGAKIILEALLKTLLHDDYPHIEPSDGYYMAKSLTNSGAKKYQINTKKTPNRGL